MEYLENMSVYKYPEQRDEIENMLGYVMENNLFLLCANLYMTLHNFQPVIDSFYNELNSWECTDVIYYRFIIDANEFGGFTPKNKETMRTLIRTVNNKFLRNYASLTAVRESNTDGQYILNSVVGNKYEDRNIIQEDVSTIYKYLESDIMSAKDELLSGKILRPRYLGLFPYNF